MRKDSPETDLTGHIARLVEPTMEDMGFSLVRIQLCAKPRQSLQVMVERRDGSAMSVDDCAGLSRAISAVLDVEDPIRGSYALEVSSPGIDRPLVRLEDFDRFAGREAMIRLGRPREGRRHFRGRILGREGELVRLAVAGSTVEFAYADIGQAKLVLTDELLKASQARQ